MPNKTILVGHYQGDFPVHEKFNISQDLLTSPDGQKIILDNEFQQTVNALNELSALANDGNTTITRDAEKRVSVMTTSINGVDRVLTMNYVDDIVSTISLVYGTISKLFTFNRDTDGNISSINVT